MILFINPRQGILSEAVVKLDLILVTENTRKLSYVLQHWGFFWWLCEHADQQLTLPPDAEHGH